MEFIWGRKSSSKESHSFPHNFLGASPEDGAAVARLLKREPQGDFEVVLRSENNQPRVIKNFPILFDGTPMPTLYWLVDAEESKIISTLESAGGVKEAECEIPLAKIARAHQKYQKERDKLIPVNHSGPLPSGGVGGTRRGIKCLHAHYAWHLAGGRDPVGKWVAERCVFKNEL